MDTQIHNKLTKMLEKAKMNLESCKSNRDEYAKKSNAVMFAWYSAMVAQGNHHIWDLEELLDVFHEEAQPILTFGASIVRGDEVVEEIGLFNSHEEAYQAVLDRAKDYFTPILIIRNYQKEEGVYTIDFGSHRYFGEIRVFEEN